jgi:hypothetical protein
MTQEQLSEDTPGDRLFPQFGQELYDMLGSEAEGLTDHQLDWQSDDWEWSKWSIRLQVSHMVSFIRNWLLIRWGDQLFPQGTAHLGQLADFPQSSSGPFLDESRSWSLSELMEEIDRAMKLAQHVLSGETVATLRLKEVSVPGTSEFWRMAGAAHSVGFNPDPNDPEKILLTLETTFRHLYYEYTTHMYNIQRLKRAQGLSAATQIPAEGYWVLPHWDQSEP